VAIVVGGVVLNGRHGASGEIGYNLRAVEDVGLDPAQRTILEQTVSGGAFLRSGLALVPRSRSAEDVFAATDHSGPASELLRSFLDELAFHLVNLCIAVDPERVVVGGGMVNAWSRIEAPLRRALQAAVPFPPELVPGAFPYDAPLRGALALGTTAAREQLTREPPVEVR
jgi:glucokinase